MPNKLEDSFNIAKFAKIDHFRTIHQDLEKSAKPIQAADTIEVNDREENEQIQANMPNLQQKLSQGIKDVVTKDRAEREQTKIEELKRQLKEKEAQEEEEKEKMEQQQKQFSSQLKKIRETLQEEYNQKLNNTVEEFGAMKVELEKMGNSKIEKAEKLC